MSLGQPALLNSDKQEGGQVTKPIIVVKITYIPSNKKGFDKQYSKLAATLSTLCSKLYIISCSSSAMCLI